MAFFLLKLCGEKEDYPGEKTRSYYKFFGAGDFYAVDAQDELRAVIDEREKEGFEVTDSMRDPRFDQDFTFFVL